MKEPTSDADKVRQVELLISNLLRWGVLSSLLVVVLGTVISFTRHADYRASLDAMRHLTAPGAAFPHTLADVASGARDGRGQAIVMVGLLLLIATPVARVGVSIFAFIYERDRAFVAITTTVFLLLLLSFVLGRAGG